jgi:hypothetical protein
VFKLAVPIPASDKREFTIVLDQQFGGEHTIGRFRVKALTDFPAAITDIGKTDLMPLPIAKILLKAQRSAAEADELETYFLATVGADSFVLGGWRHQATKEVLDVTAMDFSALDDKTWKAQTWKDASNVNTESGYAYRRIDALKAYPAKLELKAAGDCELWLNGSRLVERKNASIKQTIKQSVFLRQGRNDLLLKVAAKNNKPVINFSLKPGIDETIGPLLSRTDLNAEESQKLVAWYGTFDAKWETLNAAVVAHKKDEPKATLTSFYQAKKNGKTYGKYDIHHLVRGNSDAKLKRATPGFMQVLVRSDDQEKHWLKDAPATEPRVAFANWITDEKDGAGSLLARVIVNRIWRQHMGKGIVASTSNFGQNGARPTHPELLDWLAQTLIDNDWSQKSIHRLILNSAVYRQGVATSKIGSELDPANDLLWTRRKQRIEGEIVRDRLLQLSGKLDTRMYGKGSLSLTDPRRSVYLTVKRSKLLPFLQLFDAPAAIEGKAERNETNSAPQALTLINSPFVRDMSAQLAKRVKSESSEDFIHTVYWQVLSRAPRAKELAYFSAFLSRQTALYESDKAAAEKAAIDFCQLLICSNEFVYID